MDTDTTKLRLPARAARVLLNTVVQRWRQDAALGFLCGVAAVVVGTVLVACSPGLAPTSRTADVPLQTGKQSTTTPGCCATTALDDVETIWLNNGLLITNRYDSPQRFELVNLTRPADIPTVAESPCPRNQSPRDVQAGAGAIVVQCRTEAVGLVPEHR